METKLLGSYYKGRLWGNVFTISLSNLYWGYYIGVLSTPIDNIAYTLDWGKNKEVFTAVFSALFPLGAAIGSVVGGAMAKTRGRRKMLIVAAIYGIISSMIHAIPTTPTFAIGRFNCGIAGGVMATIPSLFRSEISPPEVSGKTGILVQFMGTFGVLVSTAIGFPLPLKGSSDPMNNWWIFMILFPIIPASLQLILFLCFYKYEPASWLINKNRAEEATASANFIYSEERAKQYILDLTVCTSSELELESLNGSREKTATENVTFKELLTFSGKYKKMMLIGMTLQILQQWCGINGIINYCGTIFRSFTGVFMARIYSFIFAFVKLFSILIAAPIIDRSGRRPLMIVGFSGMMVCLISLAFMNNFAMPEYLPVILISLYSVFFSTSAGPVIWIYCGEIMIDKGMAIAIGFNWINAAIVEVTFPYMIQFGLFVAFFVYGAVSLGGVAFCFIFLKETKGLSKEEIKKLILIESKA